MTIRWRKTRWVPVAVAIAAVAVTAIGVATASPAPSRSRIRLPVVRLVAIARSTASGLGDSHVKTALVVVTTKRAAENWMEPGAVPPGPTNPRAYLIVLRGRFVCQMCSAPSSAPLPHGRSAQIIWVPGSGITDFGLTKRTPPGLRTLGRVARLSL